MARVLRPQARTPRAATAASDVFICYSRRDRQFVERLHAALVAAGKEVYVDWEDIPVWSDDYEQELYAGIDLAGAFVFVLTPESLASPQCKLELARAVAQGKRIRPLDRRAADGTSIPDELRKPQWIAFRFDEGFDHGVAELLAALDVDVEWVRTHTRLAQRASEWEAHDGDASFLLRGNDLRRAEAWRDEQAGKDPQPTEAQLTYVRASRRAAVRRQRAAFAVVLAALGVALALGVLALVQRNNAIDERNHAVAIALAAAANDELRIDPDASLLLSLEAYRSSPDARSRSSVVAALEAAATYRGEGVLHGPARGVAFSPKGWTIAVAGGDTVRLWDARTKRLVGRPLDAGVGVVLCVAFSPDGRTLAAAGADGSIALWDIRSRRIAQLATGTPDSQLSVRAVVSGLVLTQGGGAIHSLAFSPSGRTLAAAVGRTVRIWDVRTHARLRRLTVAPARSINGVAFAPDGQTLALAGAAADGGALLRLWNLRTGRLRPSFAGSTPELTSVAFSPDGHLASAGYAGDIRLWNVTGHPRLQATLRGHTGIAYDVAFSRDGRTLASAGADHTVRLWNVRDRRPIGTPLTGHFSSVYGVSFAPTGRMLASAGADETVRLWSVRRAKNDHAILHARSGAIHGIAFDAAGKTLATAGEDGTARLWNVATLRESAPPLKGRGAVLGLAFDAAGDVLATSGTDGIRLWDRRTHAQVRLLRAGETAVRSVAFNRDGDMLASGSNDGGVRLWDPGSRDKKPLQVLAQALTATSVVFSPGGDTLASAGGAGTVTLWDMRNSAWALGVGRYLSSGSLTEIENVAFSSDGRRLATAGVDQSVRLWNVRTAEKIGGSLDGHTGSVYAVAFSPDGRTLASGSGDQTVRLWDVQSHHQLGPALRTASAVYSVAFSPDGRLLAAAGAHGTVSIWHGLVWKNFAELRSRVCGIAADHLTEEQWVQLVPGVSYRTSCDN